jgi:hypothetical protein
MKCNSTRRSFVKEVATGGAAVAAASTILSWTARAGLLLQNVAADTYDGKYREEIEMAKTKYGKYFLREPWGIPGKVNPDPNAPVYIGIGQEVPVKDWDEPITQVLRPIYRPMVMIPKGHRHNCAEILYFIGGNPMNFKDFGAEVELMMGEEAEKHIITTTTWVFVPKNVFHCPLNFKSVDRPIMFGHIMFTPTYESSGTAIPG